MAIAHVMGNQERPRVLVCDDESSFVRLLEINLQRAGYDVITASDGEAALEKAMEERPRLLLIDLLMPGMDGFELVRRIRTTETLAEIPIIVLTADVMDEDHQLVQNAGADEVLTKPVELQSLMKKIGQLTKA